MYFHFLLLSTKITRVSCAGISAFYGGKVTSFNVACGMFFTLAEVDMIYGKCWKITMQLTMTRAYDYMRFRNIL